MNTTVVWICDQCGKSQHRGEQGFPPDWFDLDRGDAIRQDRWESWDFCSWGCLYVFVAQARGQAKAKAEVASKED